MKNHILATQNGSLVTLFSVCVSTIALQYIRVLSAEAFKLDRSDNHPKIAVLLKDYRILKQCSQTSTRKDVAAREEGRNSIVFSLRIFFIDRNGFSPLIVGVRDKKRHNFDSY
jgi:hypothetical protein